MGFSCALDGTFMTFFVRVLSNTWRGWMLIHFQTNGVQTRSGMNWKKIKHKPFPNTNKRQQANMLAAGKQLLDAKTNCNQGCCLVGTFISMTAIKFCQANPLPFYQSGKLFLGSETGLSQAPPL